MDRAKVLKDCEREFDKNVTALQCPLFQAPDGSGRGLSLTLGETTQPIFHPTRELLRTRIHTLLEATGVIIFYNHHIPSAEEARFAGSTIGSNREGRPQKPESWHGDSETAINVLRRNPDHLPPRPHPTCFSTVKHIVDILERVLPDFPFNEEQRELIQQQKAYFADDQARFISVVENIVMGQRKLSLSETGEFDHAPNRLLRMIAQASENTPHRIHRHAWTSEQPETIIFWSNTQGNQGKNDVIHAKELVPVDNVFQSLPLHRARIML